MFSRLIIRRPLLTSTRPLKLSQQVRTLREIRVSEVDGETVVEGVRVESDRKGKILDVDRYKQNREAPLLVHQPWH